MTFLLSLMFLHCCRTLILPIVLRYGRGGKRMQRNMKLSLQNLYSFTPRKWLKYLLHKLVKTGLSRKSIPNDHGQLSPQYSDACLRYLCQGSETGYRQIDSVFIFIYWQTATGKHMVYHFMVSLSDLCPVTW